ncbi:hypothetical protein EK904_009874 [Melospiza melodia maxima]|nr:hypothetical protein EK904_009874 [Melospiza melodia maxima]
MTDSAHRNHSYSQSLIPFLLECHKTFPEMEGEKEQSAKATSAVGDLRKSWQTWAEDHIEYQRKNPFSSDDRLASGPAHTHRGDPTYGRPPEGSRTEQRGRDAHSHVGREVEELCSIIRRTGKVGEDGHVTVTFGQLFETYVTISNKVVGILLRARKHGLVHFEGEMLWQGKDDDVKKSTKLCSHFGEFSYTPSEKIKSIGEAEYNNSFQQQTQFPTSTQEVIMMWRSEERPQKTAVLGATQWWELGFSVSHSRTVCCDLSLHHQPRTLLRDRGHSSVWLLSRVTASWFGHITAPTLTFVIIHGYLRIMGRLGQLYFVHITAPAHRLRAGGSLPTSRPDWAQAQLAGWGQDVQMQVGYGAERWPVKTHSSEKEKKHKIVVVLIQEEFPMCFTGTTR